MNWRRSLIGVAIGLPLVALLAFGMTVNPRDIPSPLPGRPAPDFALTVLDGVGGQPTGAVDSVRLSAYHGDVVVVNFWASWCVACRAEHAVLSMGAQKYADRGVHFYGVLYNDSPENGRAWIRRMGGQAYPALLDPGARTAIDFGLYGVPETFFIGRDGRVAYKHVGPVTPEILETKLDQLLAVEPLADEGEAAGSEEGPG